MSEIKLKQRFDDCLRRIGSWKYALIILAIGMVLIAVPTKEKSDDTVSVQQKEEISDDITEKLESILGQIQGAGKTKVLLTKDEGPVSLYQTNSETFNTDDEGRQKIETVLISTGSGTEEPLVTSVTYPTYRGAVVVCEGADSATVRLNVIIAVSSLTGLSSDKIAVIKMSNN